MPRRKKIKKPSTNYYVFAIACVFFIVVLILNDSGLITYFKLKKEHTGLVEELQSLSMQQNSLMTEINKNNLSKIIVGVISLAIKAKKVIIGIYEIKFYLKKNKIYFLLQANNISFKRKENLSLPIHQKIKINCFTKEELGIAFGRKKIANIGFLKSSFINSIISDSYRLQSLRN